MSNINNKAGDLKPMGSWHGAAIRVLVGVRLGVISDVCKEDAINVLSGKSKSTFNVANINIYSRLAYNKIKEQRLCKKAKEEGMSILYEYDLAY